MSSHRWASALTWKLKRQTKQKAELDGFLAASMTREVSRLVLLDGPEQSSLLCYKRTTRSECAEREDTEAQSCERAWIR